MFRPKERPWGMRRRSSVLILAFAVTLVLASCGGSDADATDAGSGDRATETSAAATEDTSGGGPAETGTTPPDEEGAGSSSGDRGTATLVFTEEDREVDFSLDGCQTSDTAPDSAPEGDDGSKSMIIHGTSDDGAELNLASLIDASGERLNTSYFNEADQYWSLLDLTFTVDGGTVTGTVSGDIYETLDVEEAVAMSFEVTCST